MPIDQYDALLFDLDGVLVPTVELHKEAWRRLFDSVLPSAVASYTDADYYRYVDGKPQYDGIQSLFESRGITLPAGDPSDSAENNTICGLGNRKNDIFDELLRVQGVEPYADVADVLRHFVASGKRLAVVSSSRNARQVLLKAGLLKFFDEVVDGGVSAQEGLEGKPAPDAYQYAADKLGVPYSHTVVLEDALSGVAAGAAGDFGLVVGIDHGAGRTWLLDAGADIVVNQLGQLLGGIAHRTELADDSLDHDRYPIDTWKFTEYGKPSPEGATLFSLSNGTIGVRGESGEPRWLGSGTFLSGFHETFTIRHAEEAYGFARVGQVVQGVPDSQDFRFFVDDQQLSTPGNFMQSVDFRTGIATRSYRFDVDEHSSLDVEINTMVCLSRADLMVTSLTFKAHGRDLKVHVEARVNTDKPVVSRDTDPRKADMIADGGLRKLKVDSIARNDDNEDFGAYHCANSGLTMALGVCQQSGEQSLPQIFDVDVQKESETRVLRYTAYNSYPIRPVGIDQGLEVAADGNHDDMALVRRCEHTLSWAKEQGFDALVDQQRQWLDDFWNKSDVIIEDSGDGRLQQVMHWELFQLAQATATIPNGISAKGLSGTGYSGHYFWDTETYIVPFLTYTAPQLARQALSFRYRQLPAARKRAAMMNMDGALFPWRSINGEEASAFFEAGTAQYHIDADIAYAVCQYVGVTGDRDFLVKEGIDILVETARMWESLGYIGGDGAFHINTVTGPDEYSALVDDNYYTNVMAQFNLRKAAEAIDSLTPQERETVMQRLTLGSQELVNWRTDAKRMKLPFDDSLGIHLQDDEIMRREPWDFKHDTERPLLLHYHPMVIYRRRVLKQTDTVLALYLLSSQFDEQVKRRDFDFYDPLTTGDSSLSAASQSIVAAEVGHSKLAMDYFRQSLYADVANLHSNTADGIHLASAGGVWMTAVAGFGGLRDSGGELLSIDPHLPESLAKPHLPSHHPWRQNRSQGLS
ncbi:HAD-IA family hydrolase [Bifidobacterium sp. ESL0682]|uniref:HAD-IA family hydrolase n=1 Tax=Bifidobacterium sp. ESL0682 TaxID=2983212 RepID=UPI0023FA4479|nr:HAD-IA family hydrolase [Bifidobacterium sp. ESL0682]WEV42396.1 HAD-IA family hydrolase [Bifidobacterium sp. ESL0682]